MNPTETIRPQRNAAVALNTTYTERLSLLCCSRLSPRSVLVPVHRHIAEFLGARHLAQLIDGAGGLPIQRILALITGADGGVVTEMRGLSAWLAAQCPRAHMDRSRTRMDSD